MVGATEVARLAARLRGDGATVVREGAGWDHVAWRVTGADGLPWILRAAGGDPEDPLAEVQREVRVLHAARSVLGGLVADAIVVEGAEGWLAHPRLPGVPLQDLLAAAGVPHVELDRLAREVGGVIRALAEIPAPADVPTEDVLSVWLADAPANVEAIGSLLPGDLRTAVDRFLGMAGPPDPHPADLRFGHNDLGAEHILVDPATFAMTGIIDWSDAAIADQAADVGRLLRDLGERPTEAVLDAMRLTGEQRAGVRQRAWCYARCLVLEDLAYASEHRPDLVELELSNMARLFGPASGPTVSRGGQRRPRASNGG